MTESTVAETVGDKSAGLDFLVVYSKGIFPSRIISRKYKSTAYSGGNPCGKRIPLQYAVIENLFFDTGIVVVSK